MFDRQPVVEGERMVLQISRFLSSGLFVALAEICETGLGDKLFLLVF